MRIPVLIALSLVWLTGCQRVYVYEISGTIRDAETGEPLSGVQVAFDAPDATSFPTATDANGQFSAEYRVSDSHFFGRLPKWELELSKEGYQQLSIDISPTSEPKGAESPVTVIVVAHMLPQ